MSNIDQARRYLSGCPPAISGADGHKTAFTVVCEVVNGFALDDGQAYEVLSEWNRTCQPPWSDHELRHKIGDAIRLPHNKPRGHKIARGIRHKYKGVDTPKPIQAPPAPKQTSKPAKYEIPDQIDMPEPIADGARKLLLAAFEQGEGIRIAQGRSGEDGREQPKDAGVTLSREEWIRKLNDHNGNPNGFLRTSEKNGIFVSINPMKPGGSRDSDVTAFRHALLEFDNISIHEQWSIINQSGIPCTAIISSGGKSIHAWVRIDAADRKEFDERVKLIYDHFAEYKPDEKNKNPSRFSRFTNCERGNKRQELLALGVGCESFVAWQIKQVAESYGRVKTRADILNYVSGDENLIGNRWMCKGFGCLIIGPSGVGKSSLNIQMATHWAIGRPVFGITPVYPLKSLIIQAENDDGDLREMLVGVESGIGIEPGSDEDQMLAKNLIFDRDTTRTGPEFIKKVQHLVELHRPDCVWLDPILSFVGDDISKQHVIASFFRNGLAPVLDTTGVACFIVHHTGKPPSDKDARKGWHTSDYAYAGLGSSDLTNWARAVMVLRQADATTFELKLAKRGKRAGVTYPDGSTSLSVWIKHSEHGIFWEPSKKPEEMEQPKRTREDKPKEPTKPQKIATANLYSFLSACPADGEGLRELASRLNDWVAKELKMDVSEGTARSAVELLVKNEKLVKQKNLYFKGPKA